MSLTEKNVPVTNDKALIGLDEALQTIAKKMEAISWLEKSWGRAKNINGKLVNKATAEPMIYVSSKEYYSVMPNDSYKAYAFWGVTGPQIGRDQVNMPQFNLMLTNNVFCIVWVDLRKIDKTKDFIYTQELIKDVINILKKQSAFTLLQVIDERVEDIFKGYTLTPEHRDLLMYPYQAFRIEGVLNYELNLC